jgi:hypothetical protein
MLKILWEKEGSRILVEEVAFLMIPVYYNLQPVSISSRGQAIASSFKLCQTVKPNPDICPNGLPENS